MRRLIALLGLLALTTPAAAQVTTTLNVTHQLPGGQTILTTSVFVTDPGTGTFGGQTVASQAFPAAYCPLEQLLALWMDQHVDGAPLALLSQAGGLLGANVALDLGPGGQVTAAVLAQQAGPGNINTMAFVDYTATNPAQLPQVPPGFLAEGAEVVVSQGPGQAAGIGADSAGGAAMAYTVAYQLLGNPTHVFSGPWLTLTDAQITPAGPLTMQMQGNVRHRHVQQEMDGLVASLTALLQSLPDLHGENGMITKLEDARDITVGVPSALVAGALDPLSAGAALDMASARLGAFVNQAGGKANKKKKPQIPPAAHMVLLADADEMAAIIADLQRLTDLLVAAG